MAHLVLRERGALQQIVADAPLEERLRGNAVMVQGSSGDGLCPLGKVLIHVALAECMERDGVRVRPLHELPELDPIKAGCLLRAMGGVPGEELAERFLPGIEGRT